LLTGVYIYKHLPKDQHLQKDQHLPKDQLQSKDQALDNDKQQELTDKNTDEK